MAKKIFISDSCQTLADLSSAFVAGNTLSDLGDPFWMDEKMILAMILFEGTNEVNNVRYAFSRKGIRCMIGRPDIHSVRLVLFRAHRSCVQFFTRLSSSSGAI